jgi:hypothetical protein
MSDHTKEAIERGIVAVRWAVSTLVASLHKDFDPTDKNISRLSNELRKGLETIDNAWDSFCRERDGRSDVVDQVGYALGLMSERVREEAEMLASGNDPWNPERDLHASLLHPPIPGADKPNPLRRPTSEGEAQMRMEREMCKCPEACPIHGGREGEK